MEKTPRAKRAMPRARGEIPCCFLPLMLPVRVRAIYPILGGTAGFSG